VPASSDEHDGEFHGSIEGAFVLGAAHAARLARASTIAAAGSDADDGLARAHAWWPAHLTRLCAISGDVARPGVYELSVRATVGHAVGAAGGVIDGVRTAILGQAIGDGAWLNRDSRGLPTGLIAFHRGRDVTGIL
jgi:hypothetical protein